MMKTGVQSHFSWLQISYLLLISWPAASPTSCPSCVTTTLWPGLQRPQGNQCTLWWGAHSDFSIQSPGQGSHSPNSSPSWEYPGFTPLFLGPLSRMPLPPNPILPLRLAKCGLATVPCCHFQELLLWAPMASSLRWQEYCLLVIFCVFAALSFAFSV